MTSPKNTSLEEEEEDVDGVDRDGAEREEGLLNSSAVTETGSRYV